MTFKSHEEAMNPMRRLAARTTAIRSRSRHQQALRHVLRGPDTTFRSELIEIMHRAG